MIQATCLTILLIDHCVEDWVNLHQYLQQDSLYNYHILEFATVKQAIAWCQQETPDVILLNFPSPDGEGLETLGELRQILSHTQSAMILLADQENAQIAVRAMKNGAQDYLVKSQLTPATLQTAIHDAVTQRNYSWQLEQIQSQKQLINAIALRIHQSLNLKEILAITAAEVRQFLQTDRVIVYQFQPDMSGTVVAESVLPGWTVSLGQNITDTCFQQGAGAAYRQGKTRAINNIEQAGLTDCHVQLLAQFQVKANLVVPILVRNSLWGLLIAHQCTAPRQWQKLELELLEQLAVQIAIAIQQASVYEMAQTQLQERQRTEKTLKESEERFRSTFEQAAVGISHMSLSGQFLRVNQRFADIIGYSPSELKHLSCQQITHADDLATDREKAQMLLANEIQTYSREKRYICKDGRIIWIKITISLVRNTDDTPQYFISVIEDISERIDAQQALQQLNQELEARVERRTQALRESEHRYATLTEAAPVAIFRLNQEGHCVYVNERWSEMTGRATWLALGTGWLETLHSEDRDRILMQWLQREFNQPELYHSEVRHIMADGSLNWFYCHILPEIDPNGTILGYVGTFTDITERKLAEEKLHHLSERLAIAIKSGGFGIWEYDFIQKRQIWDERMYALYGVSQTDFVVNFDTWLNCLHPDDRDHVSATIEQVLQKNQEYNIDFRIIQPNGDVRYIKAYGLLSRDQQDQPVRMIGVNFDISNHKQAEQELLRNRDLLEVIYNESADAVFLVDPTTLITLDCNWRAVELFEAVNKAELLGIDGQSLQHYPFTSDQTTSIVAQMQTKGLWSQELEYITRKGKLFWGNIAAKPINIAGRTVNLVRISDISDRKQAEDALAKYAREVEDLYDQAPCGYHSLDRDGMILRVNQTELQWLGYTREEMIGQPLLKFFTPASRQAFSQNYPQFKERGLVKDVEHEMICKDGTILPVLISATAVKDAEGNYLYSRSTLFDISDRKQAEQELQASRTMLQLVLDTIPQRVFWKDCQLNYLGCNPAFANDAKVLHPDAIIGKTDFELPWQKQAVDYRADDTLVISTGTSKIGYEEPMETEDGSHIWLRTSKIPLTNNSGQVIGVLGSYEDITESKQAEEELRRTNEQLAHANAELARATRLKDEFLANMSHELRTPLNAILGMSEGFEEGVFGTINAQQAKAIATIERSGRHLLELINDILDLSKIESGKLELHLSDVAIKSLCNNSLVFIRQAALKKDIRLVTEISEHLGSIQADDRRLRQVLINLLSNAVKFTPEGGTVTLTAWLDTDKDAGRENSIPYINFCVSDTGIGIAPQDIGKLFQPFIQLDSSLNRQYNGTGLGLALVHRIISLHGGTVSVNSQVGQGSCFNVRIPYITSDQVLTTQAITQLPQKYSLTGNGPVLIIEDSMAAADQITRYLSEMGMQCVIYAMGEGAVEEAINVKPTLIILDLQLPNLSGWEVLKQLKGNPQTQHIPVLIISVVDESVKGLAEGAFAYLVKPISRAQFRATLDQLQSPGENILSTTKFGSKSTETSALILLAEDNQANINTMCGYLESRGYRLAIASNGKQAIEQVYAQRPDLIVMDIQMPEMDGLTAIRQIREDQELIHVPIIALTALAMPGDRETCLASGANEYLTKPVKLKQLITTIQQLLNK